MSRGVIQGHANLSDNTVDSSPSAWRTLSLVVYGVLFALALILINPWGSNRGDIWSYPKEITLAAIAFINIGFAWGHLAAGFSAKQLFAARWVRFALLWAAFLAFGLLSVVLSPAPMRAFLGQQEMADGWGYWAIVALFVLSNVLVLTLKPELFRAQLYGLLAGGLVDALAVFPQAFDWRLDYTATMGEVSRSANVLVSSIYKSQMPIGFFSHRGHNSFVLAAITALALVSILRGWLRPRWGWPLYFITGLALWFASTRGGTLALIVALAYLAWRSAKRDMFLKRPLWVGLCVVALLVLGYFVWPILGHDTRELEGALLLLLALLGLLAWRFQGRSPFRSELVWAVLVFALSFAVYRGVIIASSISGRNLPTTSENVDELSSGRLDLWKTAVKGIGKRPLLGWGFDGFGIAWPYSVDWNKYPGYLAEGIRPTKILSLGTFGFRYIGTDGREHQGGIYTNKAHNIFLDTLLSVGAVGLLFYLALAAYAFFSEAFSRMWGLEALAIVYAVYVLTWFESAQYSHLPWWALSVGLSGMAWARVKKSKKDPTARVLERGVEAL